MKLVFLALLSLLLNAGAAGQSAPDSARQVVGQAVRQAARENKKVLLIFRASWCGWCLRMDSSLNDSPIKPYFDSNFIITYLSVLEPAESRHLENPGAEELLDQYGGKDQGVPYWAVLDGKGKLLADSRIRLPGKLPGDNSGCPAKKEEVDYFIRVLKNTTRLTGPQLSAIAKRFRMNEE